MDKAVESSLVTSRASCVVLGCGSRKDNTPWSGRDRGRGISPSNMTAMGHERLRAVQLSLGHTKIESTVRYLGIEVDEALAIA